MKLRYILFAFIALTCLIQCQDSKTTSISGTMLNGAELEVALLQKTLKAMVPITNTTMKKGKFEMQLPEGIETGLYRLKFGNRAMDLVFDGSEKKVQINGDINSIPNHDYTVSGSALSESYVETLKNIKNRSTNAAAVKKMALTVDPLLGAAYCLGVPPIDPAKFKDYQSIAQKLTASYPEATISKDFASFAQDTEKQFKTKKTGNKRRFNVEVGQQAPDIAMENPDGKEMKLSDLKGQVVLLDFWSSWCGPCRRANPHVVETYHKYKDQGFTVFSVSLDGLKARDRQKIKNKDALETRLKAEHTKWVKAIEKDKLEWDTHVSALMSWECPSSREYGVSSIPSTFLIDKEGKIATINPRGNLAAEIQKLL